MTVLMATVTYFIILGQITHNLGQINQQFFLWNQYVLVKILKLPWLPFILQLHFTTVFCGYYQSTKPTNHAFSGWRTIWMSQRGGRGKKELSFSYSFSIGWYCWFVKDHINFLVFITPAQVLHFLSLFPSIFILHTDKLLSSVLPLFVSLSP